LCDWAGIRTQDR